MAEPVFAPCVVIPVYNHEHAIGAVVGAVRAQGVPLLLVDDGCNRACAAGAAASERDCPT